MKNFFVYSIIAVLISSCNTTPTKTDYVINGTAKGVYNGVRVYLNDMTQRGRTQAIDTAMVINEAFTFSGKVPYPKLYYVTVNGVNGRFEAMIENATMALTIDSENLTKSQLTGSKSHTTYTSYDTDYKALRTELGNAQNAYRQASFNKDKAQMEIHKKKISEINNTFANYAYDFIIANKTSTIVIPILKKQLSTRGINVEQMLEAYEAVDTAVLNTPEGKLLAPIAQQLKIQFENEKNTVIGAKAPDFSAPDPEGNTIALSDVVKKGKVTIVDFWAAWCGPCRRENPNVVRIYEKYHNKGLEIIGVGLDGRRGQKNPKEAWVKAIEDDKLTWHQVSNLNYFNDDITKQYNVKAIPSMFVLNDKGEIIAKNLRGAALENKISELLN